MCILSDVELKKLSTNLVEPFDEKFVQPSSYDLSLGDSVAIPFPKRTIDLRVDDPSEHMRIQKFSEYTLLPGESVLGTTQEIIKCPLNLSSRVDGKSSIGRLFLAIHVTAGVIDAGWHGQITLEIVNHGPWSVVLYPGMKIAQVSYFKMTSECETPYGSLNLGSHYNGQVGPTPSVGRRGK